MRGAFQEYELLTGAIRESTKSDRPEIETNDATGCRPWLVEEVRGEANDLQSLNLSCISDDAQGERLEVLWDAEIGAVALDEDGWGNVGKGLPDKAEVLAAHLRAIR